MPQKVLAFVLYSCYKMSSPHAGGLFPRRSATLLFLTALFFGSVSLSLCFSKSWEGSIGGEVCPVFRRDSLFGRVIMPDAKPTRKDRRLTKEQIIMVLQAAARKLGRAPTSVELRQLSNITI